MSRSRYQPSRVFAVLLLLLLASSGCSRNTSLRSYFRNGLRVGPQYRTPGAELEPQWIDMQSDPRLVGESADLSRWWTALGDPVLDELMAAAYDKNLPIRQAAYRIRQAEAIQGIAVGNLFPQSQQATGGYSRIQSSRNVALPLPLPRFSEFGVGFRAGWEIDFWGRFRRSVEAADANLDASIADFDNVAVLLLANVASTYVQIRTVQQQLELVRTILKFQEGSLGLAQTLFDAGKTNELDVIQGRTNVAITKSAIPQFEAALRNANNRLCILLGIAPRDLVAELPPAPIPTVSRDVQVGFPADLLRRRPDIRRVERLLKAQSEQIGIAEAALYPQISLLGSFEWRSEKLNDLLFNPKSVTALISPGFAWNILNYGRLNNGIKLEEARFQEAVLGYQQTVLLAQQDVENSMIGFLKAQEQADRLAIAVSEVNASERIARTLYEAGKIDFNRVFLIQSLQFSQQVDLVTSRASAVLNLISIYRALGGGWEIRCANGGQGVPLAESVPSRPIGEIPAIDQPRRLPESSDPIPPPPPEPVKPAPSSGDRERLRELLERLKLDQREREGRDVDSQLKELLRRRDRPEPPR